MNVECRWLLGLLVVSACSGDDPPDPPPEAPGIALNELCAEIGRVDCERIEACGLLSGPVTSESCEVRQSASLCASTRVAIEQAVSSGGVAYFELAARDCRRAVSERPCEFGFDYDILRLPECAAMLEAGAAVGGDCHLGQACGADAWCDPGMTCPGTCKAFKQNNEMCDFGDRCRSGLFCGVTSRRCLAQVALTAVCELPLSGNSCVNGGYCDSSQPGEPVCRPVRGRGQGCQSPNECIVGSRCIRNRCSAGEDGDTCEDTAQCQPGLLCAVGKCSAPIDADAACDPAGIPCRAGYTCQGPMDMATCVAQGASAASCSSDEECFLGRCENDMCVSAVEDGGACTGARDCLPDRTCDEKCIPPLLDCSLGSL